MELPSERIVSWVDPTQAGCMAGTHSIGLLQAGEPTEASKGHKAGHFQGISEGMEARMSRETRAMVRAEVGPRIAGDRPTWGFVAVVDFRFFSEEGSCYELWAKAWHYLIYGVRIMFALIYS